MSQKMRCFTAMSFVLNAVAPDQFQGGHGTGKTGNLVLTFSRQGNHREFCSNREKFANTGKIFEL